MRFAEGANYAVDVEDGIAELRVWKRTDLSYEAGAQLAEEMASKIRALAADAQTRGFILDLREAPVLIGKQTRRSLGDLVFTCEAAGRPIGVVVNAGAHHAVIAEALTPRAPKAMRVCIDHGDALAWARAELR